LIELDRSLLFQVVNFLVLLGFLYLFLFKPVRLFLAERSDSIRRTKEETQRAQEEAEKRLSEYSLLLSRAQQEIEAMKEVARNEALAERQRMIREAKEEAKRVLQETKREIESEVRFARQELRKEVVNLSAAMTERLLRKSLGVEEQRRLLLESLEELGEKN